MMHPIDTKQRPQLYTMNFLKLMSFFFFRPYVSSIQNRVLGNFATRDAFWIWDIRTNCKDYLTKTILSLYLLNCFNIYFLIYILGQNASKNYTRKNFELYQAFVYKFLRKNDKMFITIFELYQVWQNVSILLMRIKSITH